VARVFWLLVSSWVLVFSLFASVVGLGMVDVVEVVCKSSPLRRRLLAPKGFLEVLLSSLVVEAWESVMVHGFWVVGLG